MIVIGVVTFFLFKILVTPEIEQRDTVRMNKIALWEKKNADTLKRTR